MTALALAGALAAAVCYGGASVLQAIAARATAAAQGLDARLLLRLARSAPYVGGLVLDLAGFALSALALRRLPLFVVQAAVAGSLAVTALLAQLVLHHRMRGRETVGVGAVVAGLVALGVAAQPEPVRSPPAGLAAGTVVTVGLLVVVGALLARADRPSTAPLLGLLAGLGFGVVGVSARLLHDPSRPLTLLTDPFAYTLVAAGLLATLLFATALQRGGVTATSAAVVAGETILPALVGVLLLGDRARPGLAPLAGAGFVAAIGGAVLLAGFAEVEAGQRA